ncbi:MAG: hypothetical protein L0Z55_08625 [Planctomycetes bacterium]|nr:hypothetical protein [Planctomycetota bacterium]
MREFYRDFAAAYGTCWLVLIGVAVLTMSRIDTGAFGLFGFPAIAFIYALIRRSNTQREVQKLGRRVIDLEIERHRQQIQNLHPPESSTQSPGAPT